MDATKQITQHDLTRPGNFNKNVKMLSKINIDMNAVESSKNTTQRIDELGMHSLKDSALQSMQRSQQNTGENNYFDSIPDQNKTSQHVIYQQ